MDPETTATAPTTKPDEPPVAQHKMLTLPVGNWGEQLSLRRLAGPTGDDLCLVDYSVPHRTESLCALTSGQMQCIAAWWAR